MGADPSLGSVAGLVQAHKLAEVEGEVDPQCGAEGAMEVGEEGHPSARLLKPGE